MGWRTCTIKLSKMKYITSVGLSITALLARRILLWSKTWPLKIFQWHSSLKSNLIPNRKVSFRFNNLKRVAHLTARNWDAECCQRFNQFVTDNSKSDVFCWPPEIEVLSLLVIWCVFMAPSHHCKVWLQVQQKTLLTTPNEIAKDMKLRRWQWNDTFQLGVKILLKLLFKECVGDPLLLTIGCGKLLNPPYFQPIIPVTFKGIWAVKIMHCKYLRNMIMALFRCVFHWHNIGNPCI